MWGDSGKADRTQAPPLGGFVILMWNGAAPRPSKRKATTIALPKRTCAYVMSLSAEVLSLSRTVVRSKDKKSDCSRLLRRRTCVRNGGLSKLWWDTVRPHKRDTRCSHVLGGVVSHVDNWVLQEFDVYD